MRKIVVSERVTLDGVYDTDMMDQWFMPYQSDERMDFIMKMVHASDAFLLGRTTYEMLGAYWSPMKKNEEGLADRMNSAHKYVVSTTLKKGDWGPSTIIKENVAEEAARLKAQSGQDILVFGSGTLVRSLMDAGVIDEYVFLVQPIVMGSGKRFFTDGMSKTPLKLSEIKSLSMGVNMLRYEPAAK